MTEQDMYKLARNRPDWLPVDAEFDGELVLGWALLTEHVAGDELLRPTGYMIVTDGSYVETDLDGLPYRVKSLKMMKRKEHS